ncbi:MAG: hypothetical protein A3G34_02255 [Candidatus Lindowbacteria bacterium RIFCSPLOWO2_12_FULL_62_27]|nr:MAG: hypothetical protein A3G34_02255 [Candidatus Lindowbacteria bacterium RIFCSPLOWO2_12_FULL_62_27]OGH61212.1 MAG: hypothetical protein A3I06_15535 [Candidatus Lindowbacteria bacterium RIFCSPLOWO2_02_FULL_62_12]
MEFRSITKNIPSFASFRIAPTSIVLFCHLVYKMAEFRFLPGLEADSDLPVFFWVVMPAKAGIQSGSLGKALDSRGNDEYPSTP